MESAWWALMNRGLVEYGEGLHSVGPAVGYPRMTDGIAVPLQCLRRRGRPGRRTNHGYLARGTQLPCGSNRMQPTPFGTSPKAKSPSTGLDMLHLSTTPTALGITDMSAMQGRQCDS